MFIHCFLQSGHCVNHLLGWTIDDTYGILQQSGRGTQRLTLVKEKSRWRAGLEVEQIGYVPQDFADLLGEVINEVRR